MPRRVAAVCTWLALLASGCAAAHPKPTDGEYQSWGERVSDIERRCDPHFAAAGRLYLDALQPALGVVAAVGIVAMVGVLVYGLCVPNSGGFGFNR